MEKIIESFENLTVSEKKIFNYIVKKDNIDEIIDSFQKLKINKNISHNLKKTINIFTNYINILKNKKRCIYNLNNKSPKWVF